MNYFIDLVQKNLNDKELLFGLYKLIYCGVTGEVQDNKSYSIKILSKDIETGKYIKYQEDNDSKAIKGFLEIKGILKLLNLLSTNSNNIFMTGNLIL